MNSQIRKRIRALLIIDLQKDFMEGGSLAIANASHILPFINDLIVTGEYDLIIATQDMHPELHSSFKIWIKHCVQFTEGAAIHPGLALDRVHMIWRKGMNPNVDSHGAFLDNDGNPTGLTAMLLGYGITDVDIVGLAIDYCVGYTGLQSAPHFKTRVLLDGCKGVGIKPEDIPAMIEKLRQAGVEVVGG